MQTLRSGSPPETPAVTSYPVLQKRRAGLEDLASLLCLEELCFDESRRDTRETIRRGFRHPNQETWVWELENEIIGSLVIRFVRGGGRIYSLATHPHFRGKGIGNEALAFAFKRAEECNCRNITLEVDEENDGLISWYEKHGFRQTSVLFDYYEKGRHALRMKRPLGIALEG